MPVFDLHMHIGRRDQLTPRMIAYFEETISPAVLDLLDQITPQSLSDFLEREGIRTAVLLAEYSRNTTGVIPNEFIADFCRASDRLIAFGSLDLDSAVDTGTQTEHCVKELGCRGLKLLPSYGHYYPDDPRLKPAYETARDLGIPVMFHTGTSLFPGSRIKYADPLLLDDVAEDFPELTIIVCHAGRPFWYQQSEWMLRRHRNVHIDLSGIPLRKVPHLFPKLEQLGDRFLFGSDWPNVPSPGHQASLVREWPYRKETIEAILWGNAARLLHLSGYNGCQK